MTAISQQFLPSTEKRSDKLPLMALIFGGALWCLLLAMLWPGEAPGKGNSMIAAITAYALALFVIGIGRSAGIIRPVSPWIFAFLVKLTVSYLVLLFCWDAPLEKIGLLRTPDVFECTQDANLYDFQAMVVAENGIGQSLNMLNFTWQSVGIVAYLASIYSIFGVSVLYVAMFNAVMSLIAFVSLTGILIVLSRERHPIWQNLRWGMLIPYLVYYEATPSKEPITHAVYFASLLCLTCLLILPRLKLRYLLGAFIGIGLLTVIRANAAFLLLIANLFFIVRRVGLIRGTILTAILAGLIVTTVYWTSDVQAVLLDNVFNPQRWFEVLSGNMAARMEAGDSALKLAVGQYLLPRNWVSLIVLAPIRTVIWLLLPYPLIVPSWSHWIQLPALFEQETMQYVRQMEGIVIGSTWLIIILTPALWASWKSITRRELADKVYGYLVLAANMLIPALIIGNLMFIMGRRYRMLLEPLLLAMALWGIHYGQPARYRFLYVIFFVGIAVFEIYRLF